MPVNVEVSLHLIKDLYSEILKQKDWRRNKMVVLRRKYSVSVASRKVQILLWKKFSR